MNDARPCFVWESRRYYFILYADMLGGPIIPRKNDFARAKRRIRYKN